eukprot:jgi/Botrbrau1/7304/Bobra.247_3s0001.1
MWETEMARPKGLLRRAVPQHLGRHLPRQKNILLTCGMAGTFWMPWSPFGDFSRFFQRWKLTEILEDCTRCAATSGDQRSQRHPYIGVHHYPGSPNAWERLDNRGLLLHTVWNPRVQLFRGAFRQRCFVVPPDGVPLMPGEGTDPALWIRSARPAESTGLDSSAMLSRTSSACPLGKTRSSVSVHTTTCCGLCWPSGPVSPPLTGLRGMGKGK